MPQSSVSATPQFHDISSATKRRWRPRFSLRTLMLTLLLGGSAIALWLNGASWHRLSELKGSDNQPQFRFSAFTADGQRVVGVDNEHIYVWDVVSGNRVRIFPGHNTSEKYFCQTPHGPIVAVVGADHEYPVTIPPVKYEGVLNRKVTLEITGSACADALDLITSAFLKKTGMKFVIDPKLEPDELKEEVRINVRDVDLGVVLNQILKSARLVMEIRKDEIFITKRFISAEQEEAMRIRIWDLESGTLISQLSGHEGLPQNFRFSTDGTTAITFEDTCWRQWDVFSGKLLHTYKKDARLLNHYFQAICLQGRLAVFAGSAEQGIYNIESGEKLLPLDGLDEWNLVVISPDQKRALVAARDKPPVLWNIESKQQMVLEMPPMATFTPHTIDYTVTFTLHNRRMITGNLLVPAIWDLTSGMKLVDLSGAFTCTLSRDSRRIVCDYNNHILIYNDSDGTRLTAFSRYSVRGMSTPFYHQPYYASPARFSPDGTRILAVGNEYNLTVWQRRRPEQWWGLAWLPEFWLTFFFAAGLIWSVRRG